MATNVSKCIGSWSNKTSFLIFISVFESHKLGQIHPTWDVDLEYTPKVYWGVWYTYIPLLGEAVPAYKPTVIIFWTMVHLKKVKVKKGFNLSME